MKKILLALVILVMASVSAHASAEAISKRLRDSDGNVITSLAIANGATLYTEGVQMTDNVGYASILVTEDKSGGAGSVTITAEYSNDDTNFYTVYTTSGGTLTAESAVVTTLANQTRWIQHTARLAKYVRYKIVANANSQLTFDALWQRIH